MKHHYEDIRDRIPDPPKWFDENGTPRWCDFSPQATSDIYASEACLIAIECQGCGTPFQVCLSYYKHSDRLPLSADVKNIHYGDPPNVDCCASGPTMNSIPRKVLEFWRNDQDTGYNWKRFPELEIELEGPWDEDY